MDAGFDKDVGGDRCSVEELRALVRRQQKVIDRLLGELKSAKAQVTRLQDQAEQHPTERLDEAYSVQAEEKRKRGGGRKQQKSARRGRRSTAEKMRNAEATEDVLPDGVLPQEAEVHREQFAVRLIGNRAVSVVYRFFRQRGTLNTGTAAAEIHVHRDAVERGRCRAMMRRARTLSSHDAASEEGGSMIATHRSHGAFRHAAGRTATAAPQTASIIAPVAES